MSSVVPLRKRHIDHRGDQMPNIIKTMQLGNTTVMIADTYLPKTAAEREAVEESISEAFFAWWDTLTDDEKISYNEFVERHESAV